MVQTRAQARAQQFNTPKRNWNALFRTAAASAATAAGTAAYNYLTKSAAKAVVKSIGGKMYNPYGRGYGSRRYPGLYGKIGAISSKSRGFFKKGTKKYARNKFARASTTDVVKTFEYGTVDSQKYCSYIGHATCPSSQVLEVFTQSLVKLLAERMGVDIVDLAAFAPVVAGDIFRIEWQTIGGLSSGANYTVPGAVTWAAIADAIRSLMVANLTDNTSPSLLLFLPINPAVGAVAAFSRVYLNLRTMKIRVMAKSTLKLQNRSKNTTAVGEDQADEVDNVPIYGKSYEGRGCGTQVGFQGSADLFADKVRGFIYTNIGGSTTSPMREPPMPNIFTNVNKSGKMHLDPSEIKTSVLTHSVTMTLNKFIMAFIVNDDQHSVGKFRFFAMEKMIETVSTVADVIPITIGFELNSRIAVKVITKKTNNTISQFAVVT